MQKILIFPYNGNAIEALTCLKGKYHVIGFIDDDKLKQGDSSKGFPVFSRDAIKRFPEAKVLAVPGSPLSYQTREKIILSLRIPGERFVTLIHPKAVVSPLATIGKNVLIMAGVVITSDAIIGDNVCVLPNSVIHHDVKIGDNTLIGSNVVIAGRVAIGKNCYVGSGATIINDVQIGNNVLVGMATNVIRSIKANSKVVGNPARYI